MTLLLLTPGSRRDRKRVLEHSFQTSECDTIEPVYELNHASRLPILGVTKSKTKRAFLEGNSQEKCLHDNRCSLV